MLKKSKSDAAFEHNVKTEMHSGKPQKQALAIAYAVKRRAQHKAMGGMIEDDRDIDMLDPVQSDNNFLSAEDGSETPFGNQGMSDSEELQESGFEPEPQMDNQQSPSILEGVMRKLHRKHFGRY